MQIKIVFTQQLWHDIPGVYQLAQILIKSIKYLQTCLHISFHATPDQFVYVLFISQRGIAERKKISTKQHESLKSSTYLETADSILIYEF